MKLPERLAYEQAKQRYNDYGMDQIYSLAEHISSLQDDGMIIEIGEEDRTCFGAE